MEKDNKKESDKGGNNILLEEIIKNQTKINISSILTPKEIAIKDYLSLRGEIIKGVKSFPFWSQNGLWEINGEGDATRFSDI